MEAVCGTKHERLDRKSAHQGGRHLSCCGVCASVAFDCHRKVNIADDPSREDYAMLQSLDAVEVSPVLDSASTDAQAWESLSLGSVEQIRRAVPSLHVLERDV